MFEMQQITDKEKYDRNQKFSSLKWIKDDGMWKVCVKIATDTNKLNIVL